MTAHTITLLVPGLLETVARGGRMATRLEALETLFARGSRSSRKGQDYYRSIYALFDDQSALNTIPIAAISRLAESGQADDRLWMRVDPVYLEADKDRLLMLGNSHLQLQAVETEQLIDELNALYCDEGLHFEAHANERWYVALDAMPKSHFYSPDEVLGRSVEPFLPRGEDQAYWHRFMNEVQMMLHASEINQQRLENGLPPVNSIWCWGPGQQPQSLATGWSAIYADDAYVRGIAMLAGADCHAQPANATEVIDRIPASAVHTPAQILVVLKPTAEDILTDDCRHHAERLAELETSWFAPLSQALKQGRIAQFRLITGDGETCVLDKKALRRFWRRRKRLA